MLDEFTSPASLNYRLSEGTIHAYTNSASAVVLVVWTIFITASLAHLGPSIVFGRDSHHRFRFGQSVKCALSSRAPIFLRQYGHGIVDFGRPAIRYLQSRLIVRCVGLGLSMKYEILVTRHGTASLNDLELVVSSKSPPLKNAAPMGLDCQPKDFDGRMESFPHSKQARLQAPKSAIRAQVIVKAFMLPIVTQIQPVCQGAIA